MHASVGKDDCKYCSWRPRRQRDMSYWTLTPYSINRIIDISNYGANLENNYRRTSMLHTLWWAPRASIGLYSCVLRSSRVYYCFNLLMRSMCNIEPSHNNTFLYLAVPIERNEAACVVEQWKNNGVGQVGTHVPSIQYTELFVVLFHCELD